MKKLKVIVLLVLTTAALMALAGNASADYATTTTGAPTPTLNSVKIHTTNHSNEHVIFQNPIAQIECFSTAEGTVETHTGGTSGNAATGKLSALTFTSCTDNWHVTTRTLGALYLDWTSGHNGTLFSEGTTVEATRFFVPCYYKTEDTHIGTVTGGNPATLHIEATIPLEKATSSELCGAGNAKWEGGYVTTGALYVADGH
jgi:hypothetical protein